jgi:hypothetical protein
MTTAFQYVFNNAESISINRRRVIGSTVTRDNTVRAVSRGGQAWRFEVKLPDGIRWSDARGAIEKIEFLDRSTVGTVQINNAGYNSWLTPYQGNSTGTFTATATIGSNSITLTGGQPGSGFNFRAGDFIQLGASGHVYSVVSDVVFSSNTVTLNRPVIDATNTYTLTVGPSVTWSVICTDFPTWTIFARDQVSWSGPFVFSEDLT